MTEWSVVTDATDVIKGQKTIVTPLLSFMPIDGPPFLSRDPLGLIKKPTNARCDTTKVKMLKCRPIQKCSELH